MQAGSGAGARSGQQNVPCRAAPGRQAHKRANSRRAPFSRRRALPVWHALPAASRLGVPLCLHAVNCPLLALVRRPARSPTAPAASPLPLVAHTALCKRAMTPPPILLRPPCPAAQRPRHARGCSWGCASPGVPALWQGSVAATGSPSPLTVPRRRRRRCQPAGPREPSARPARTRGGAPAAARPRAPGHVQHRVPGRIAGLQRSVVAPAAR